MSEFLSAAVDGVAGLILDGDAGIGKTTLALETCQRAQELGFHVLSTRGAPSEVSLSFFALADLLADIDEEVLDGLPPVQQGALNRILLRGTDMPAADERAAAAAFQSVVQRLAAATPVLIAIDDAQWLDTPSATAVRFAVRRLSCPVGVLVTARTGEPDSPDMLSWLQLARPDAVTRVRIAPLTFGGLHSLISSRLGRVLPRQTMLRIYEISAGNPLYALELARAVDDGMAIDRRLPDTLAMLVRSRVKHIDADAARLLLAAACTIAPTVDVVGRATDTAPQRVLELLESAEAARIVDIDGHAIRFVHPLLATGVYTGADPISRREMHRRLADIVVAPELKARHLASAATTADADTLEALDSAAAITRGQGAPAAAAELVELAISLGGDSPVRRVIAARYHFEAGSIPLARRHLEGTAELLPAGAIRGVAMMLQGAIDGYDGSFTAAVDGLTAGVAEVGDEQALRLQGLLLLAPATGITGRAYESIQYAREAVACANQIDDAELQSQALTMWVNLNFMYGGGLDGEALARALKLQGTDRAMHVNMHADAMGAVLDSWTGELARATSRMESVRAECVQRGNELDIIWIGQHLVSAYLWSADFRAAGRIADELSQHAEQIGGHHALLFALRCQAAVAAHTGDADGCRAAAGSAIALAEQTGGVFLSVSPRASLASLELSLGEYPAALRILEPVIEGFDPELGTEMITAGWLPDGIEVLCGVGRTDEAENLVKELQHNGIRLHRPWMLAMAARGRAWCQAARGDLEAAEQSAHDALAHHEQLPMPFEKARTQLVLGHIQRRRRQKQAAMATLSDAVQVFEQLAAPLWTLRAKQELDRLTPAVRTAAGLTRSEERVARLAAAGLSNKEIAAQLFVSNKTVETNLSSVYRKLGIRSRSQLHHRLTTENLSEIPDSADGLTP